VALATLVTTAGAFAPVRAADGQIDLSFGNSGRVVTQFAGKATAAAILVQPGGKICAIGFAPQPGEPGHYGPAIVRYTLSGSLDTGFGLDGTYLHETGYFQTEIYTAAVRPDGRLLLAGRVSRQFGGFDWFLLGLDASGLPDPSFGDNGQVVADVGYSSKILDVAVQPDGKIVATGWADAELGVMRFDANGTPDQSFGDGGKVVIPVPNDRISAEAVAVQPDGKVVVAGQQYADVVVARFTSSGERDPDFGEAGIVRYNPPFCQLTLSSLPKIGDVAIQADGKIVVLGKVSTCDDRLATAFLLRLKTDGNPDTKFGSAGLSLIESMTNQAWTGSVLLQRDDRMLVAGTRWVSEVGVASVLGRFGKKGALDLTFGEGGRAGSTFETLSYPNSFVAAQQLDGNLVIFGAPAGDFIVERYVNVVSPPKVTGARIEGGRLVVDGRYFDRGAVILINGEAQETEFEPDRPGRTLSSKSAVRNIPQGRGVRIQVRTSDWAISNKFRFTR